MSLSTDTVILVLPILLVWPLNMALRKKIKVVCILGVGGLTLVSNIYRLWLTFHALGIADNSFFTIRLIFAGYVDVFPIT